MKKRVTIYVEENVWKDIRKKAIDEGKSAGDYLVDFHESLVENTKPVKPCIEIPDQKKIEQAKERLLKKRVEKKSPKISKSDEAMLLSKMKGLGIKQPENFFNPMSKDRQLGKRKK